MRILITRPEPAASQTAKRLQGLGHEGFVEPMLRIAYTNAPLPEGAFDAVAFTSINGVQALAAHPEAARVLPLPAFTVGPRTAREARSVGFADVTDCDGNAEALAGRIGAALPAGARILHATGEDRAADLAALLDAPGLKLELAVIYAAPPVEHLSEEARAALAAGTFGAAVHFSSRTVRTLLDCVAAADLNPALVKMRHLCLSQQVGGPLGALGITPEVAAEPNEDALLALL